MEIAKQIHEWSPMLGNCSTTIKYNDQDIIILNTEKIWTIHQLYMAHQIYISVS